MDYLEDVRLLIRLNSVNSVQHNIQIKLWLSLTLKRKSILALRDLLYTFEVFHFMFNCRVCSGGPWDIISSWIGEKPVKKTTSTPPAVPHVSSGTTVLNQCKKSSNKTREFCARSEDEVKRTVQSW
jgi:hypothetical protein